MPSSRCTTTDPLMFPHDPRVARALTDQAARLAGRDPHRRSGPVPPHRRRPRADRHHGGRGPVDREADHPGADPTRCRPESDRSYFAGLSHADRGRVQHPRLLRQPLPPPGQPVAADRREGRRPGHGPADRRSRSAGQCPEPRYDGHCPDRCERPLSVDRPADGREVFASTPCPARGCRTCASPSNARSAAPSSAPPGWTSL